MIFIHKPDEWAQGYYRASLPADMMRRQGLSVDCSESLTSNHFTSYVFHRVPKAGFLPCMTNIKAMGKTLVHELDDDVWSIPEWNPAFEAYNNKMNKDLLEDALDLSDRIIVSTEHLKQVVGETKPGRLDKTYVLPNLIDLDVWKLVNPRTEHDKVRILWTGSVHHDGDLEEISLAVETIVQRFKDRATVYFFGDMPKSMVEWLPIRGTHLATFVPHSRYAGSVGWIRPVLLRDYADAMKTIEPDIALCPLADIPFNRSKSGIKFHECALAGAAVVATDLEPYQFEASEGWRVKPGRPGAWVERLTELVEDADLRTRTAARQKASVEADHSWQRSAKAKLWADFFADLDGGER